MQLKTTRQDKALIGEDILVLCSTASNPSKMREAGVLHLGNYYDMGNEVGNMKTLDYLQYATSKKPKKRETTNENLQTKFQFQEKAKDRYWLKVLYTICIFEMV